MALVVASTAMPPAAAKPPAEQAEMPADTATSELTITYGLLVDADVSDAQVIPASANVPARAEKQSIDPTNAERNAKSTPTHHQTGAITANVAGQPQTNLKCFCLTPDNRILAGCVEALNEIRVFAADGKYLETWTAPFQPEAIYARTDGAVFLAGEGKLAKLTAAGEVELECTSPHAAAISTDRDKIREEVIAQAKRSAEMYAQQTEQYDKMLEQVDKQTAEIEKQIAELDAAASEAAEKEAADGQGEAVGLSSERRFTMRKQMLERRLAMQERMKEQYEQTKEQWAQIAEQNKQPELTDEQIEQQIESSIRYKLQASSISATESEVFLATHAAVGYGFVVWRMDNQFADGEQIISDLSGCCGQMDVKVNDDGLFVAENSRHRVCRYDRDGNLIGNWGHGARSGLEGFGSCCNPMNVAFGPGGAVYTSEDDTGRIKRYSPDGELLGLVGSVDLVPGCKNVSIAVNSDGSRVYMMDITKSRILRMEPYAPGEAPGPVKLDEVPVEGGETLSYDSSGQLDVGGALVDGLKSVFGFGD
jgi:hypothetical protein